MTVDLGKLFRKDYAIKTNLEATSSFVCQRYISSILTTCHQNVEFLPLLRVVKRAYCDCSARFAAEAILTDLLKCLRMQ